MSETYQLARSEEFVEAIDALLDGKLVEWVGKGPDLAYRVTDLGFRGCAVLLALVSNLIELADPQAYEPLQQVQDALSKARFRLF